MTILRSNLVHDCDPGDEQCYCFSQADIDAFERALRLSKEDSCQTW